MTAPAVSEREAAASVAAQLREAGHVAYFAGGCVRDRLLGLHPKDHDVATDAVPERVREIFPRARSVGEAFGVMLVRRDGHTVEVATFRADGTYSDARRPDAVHWSDPAGDARRRDFTINGLFEDPVTEAVIDHVGGQADLEAGIIRAIGDPHARLHEDRLRTLRAVRFAARHGFVVEPATAAAIAAAAPGLAAVSRERIGQELRLMLGHAERARAVQLMHELRLQPPIFEGFTAVPGPAGPWLRGLPAGAVDPAVAMAAWITDAHGGDVVGGPGEAADLARGWREALVLSNRESEDLEQLLLTRADLVGPRAVTGIAARKRLIERPCFPGVLALERAGDRAGGARLATEARRLAASGLRPPLLVDGHDLRAAGFPPGPAYREALEAVGDAQRTGVVRTRAQAMAMAAGVLQSARGAARGGPPGVVIAADAHQRRPSAEPPSYARNAPGAGQGPGAGPAGPGSTRADGPQDG